MYTYISYKNSNRLQSKTYVNKSIYKKSNSFYIDGF